MKEQNSFSQFFTLSQEIAHLNSSLALLSWDQEIFMPKGSAPVRCKQLGALAEVIHDKKTSKTYEKYLDKLVDLTTGKIKLKNLDPLQTAAIREWYKDYLHSKKLPTSFVRSFSELCSEATEVWTLARKNNDFSLFCPFLEKIIDFSRKKSELLGYKESPYDAHLEIFEPGMTAKKLTELFSSLKKDLKSLLNKISAKGEVDASLLYQKLGREKQLLLGNTLLKALPTDNTYMRMDESTHPFSLALHPKDVRITTRIAEKDFISNLFSILHECGHAFYEQGLPSAYFGSPLCEAASVGIHESQSRFWETRIGRSRAFWEFFYPEVQKVFPEFASYPLENFYTVLHKVAPSYIRVESDELTYCLHIILRFELEKELLEKKLEPKDLPEAWKEKSLSLLGIAPTNHQEGCLQDVHWSSGLIGYFPTYALGNLYAAQIFEVFEKNHLDWEPKVMSGEFAFIKEWLKKQVHEKGRLYPPLELVEKISEKKFSTKPFLTYLHKKYGEIYAF